MELATGFVVIVKVALVPRPGIVTLAGTLAADELSLNDTTTPPLGAVPLSVTVPREADPPRTLAGLIKSVLNTGGVTVSTAVLVTPLLTAEIVTGVELATGFVVIVKVALVPRPGIVTLAGTLVADNVSLLSDIVTPPLGAAPLNVIVPWEVDPPVTLAGLMVSVLNTGGVTVSTAVFVTPL